MSEEVLEEVRRLREELSEKIRELEKRIRKLEDLASPAKLIAINWRIARIEASAHRIFASARNALTSVPELERDLEDYFRDLGDLIVMMMEEVGEVGWNLVKTCTSIVVHAAKEAGIPFRIVADFAVERLGSSAAKALDEDVIKKTYGLVDWDYWRSLVARLERA